MKDSERHDELIAEATAANRIELVPTASEQSGHDSPVGVDYQDPLLGTTLAERYQIQSVIGSGATSCVYRAQDLRLDRTVAVKLLHSHLASDSDTIRRFQQEVKTASVLNHASSVPIHDSGVTKTGQPFLVMEFVEGRTLTALIKENAGVELERAIQLFLQICACLLCAHERGIVHRDLKPGNLLIATDTDGKDRVRVLDFGIAKIMPVQGETFQRMTQCGEMMGSLLYMSPEQCLDQDLDGRCDIYSLGCVMYETLAGKPPLCGRTAFETMNKHLTDMPEKLTRVRPDFNLPHAIEQIIFKAMAKKPEHRYQTIAELIDALKTISDSSTKNSIPTGIGRNDQSLVQQPDVKRLMDAKVDGSDRLPAQESIQKQAELAIETASSAASAALWFIYIFAAALVALSCYCGFHLDLDLFLGLFLGLFLLILVAMLFPVAMFYNSKAKLPALRRVAEVVSTLPPIQMHIRKVSLSGEEGTGKYLVLLASDTQSQESNLLAEAVDVKSESQPFWSSMAAAAQLDDLSGRKLSTDVYLDPETGEPIALVIRGQLIFLRAAQYAKNLAENPRA